MHRSWFFVVAVWCVLGRAESASIEDPDQLHDARLIGGGPVDTKLPQPIVAELIERKRGKFRKTCEALMVKRHRNEHSSDFNYYLTAAECFRTARDDYTNYFVRDYMDCTDSIQPISRDFKIYPKYDNKTKAHNLAVFKIEEFSDDRHYEIRIGDEVSGPSSAQAEVFAWRNTSQQNDPKGPFKLHSLKTKIISSVWCKLLYPFSPLKKFRVCASGWFFNGLTEDQIGTPLLQRDPKVYGRFWLTGIATNIRPWSPYLSFPMEFVDIRPYQAWIASVTHE